MIGFHGLLTQFDRDRKYRLDWPQFGAAMTHLFRESGGMPHEAQVILPCTVYTPKERVTPSAEKGGRQFFSRHLFF